MWETEAAADGWLQWPASYKEKKRLRTTQKHLEWPKKNFQTTNWNNHRAPNKPPEPPPTTISKHTHTVDFKMYSRGWSLWMECFLSHFHRSKKCIIGDQWKRQCQLKVKATFQPNQFLWSSAVFSSLLKWLWHSLDLHTSSSSSLCRNMSSWCCPTPTWSTCLTLPASTSPSSAPTSSTASACGPWRRSSSRTCRAASASPPSSTWRPRTTASGAPRRLPRLPLPEPPWTVVNYPEAAELLRLSRQLWASRGRQPAKLWSWISPVWHSLRPLSWWESFLSCVESRWALHSTSLNTFTSEQQQQLDDAPVQTASRLRTRIASKHAHAHTLTHSCHDFIFSRH